MDDGTGALWNADGAEFYLIFEIKKKFVNAMEVWDLKDAYWKLRLLRAELDAKWKRGESTKFLKKLEEDRVKHGGKEKHQEKEQVDSLMDIVDEEWVTYESLASPTSTEQSRFYKILEGFYMYLCHMMKVHKMYFREGEDMTLAVLRR